MTDEQHALAVVVAARSSAEQLAHAVDDLPVALAAGEGLVHARRRCGVHDVDRGAGQLAEVAPRAAGGRSAASTGVSAKATSTVCTARCRSDEHDQVDAVVPASRAELAARCGCPVARQLTGPPTGADARLVVDGVECVS